MLALRYAYLQKPITCILGWGDMGDGAGGMGGGPVTTGERYKKKKHHHDAQDPRQGI